MLAAMLEQAFAQVAVPLSLNFLTFSVRGQRATVPQARFDRDCIGILFLAGSAIARSSSNVFASQIDR